MRMFDSLYNPKRTPEAQALFEKFTQGDYRRFCVMFYLQTRKLIKDAVLLMTLEKKKVIQPRHLLVSAVLSDIIPRHMVGFELTARE